MYKNFETKQWHGVINRKNGVIIVVEKTNDLWPRNKELNVKKRVNDPPCTEDDLIIIAARKVLKEEEVC